MANCKFLRQKKQVQINGEWVDTRSYRYIPYCDGGTPCVIVKNSEPNGKVVIGLMDKDGFAGIIKTMSLDADGNGYIELESEDCIAFVKSEKDLPSSIVEIRGCYVSKFGAFRLNYDNTEILRDMGTMIISCSTYKRPINNDYEYENEFYGYNIIFRGFDTSNVTDMGYMFYRCGKLTSLDLSGLDTSNVTRMSSMFDGCSSLTSLDLSNFNTSNVTDMGEMFSRCIGLTSLDVSNFNTSNVTNMDYMFTYCSGLKSLDLSNFDTSNVTSMYMMFYGCNSLKLLDLRNFNTSNVTTMENMFEGCYSLKSLDVSRFDTSKITTMYKMFLDCSGLTSLDLSRWNTSKVNLMGEMFKGCSKLNTITMVGCEQPTIDKIKAQLTKDGISLDNVRIVTE